METPRPKRIFVEPAAEADPLTRRILEERSAGLEVLPYPGDGARPGRCDLVLRRRQGGWIKPFRGGGDFERPEFFLASVEGCPFHCAYCFLQGTLDAEAPTVFTNVDVLATEWKRFLASPAAAGARVHAAHLGELAVWESWTGVGTMLADLAGNHPATVLEIRTKTALAEPWLGSDLPGNVVLSWTVTPRPAARAFEPGTPGPGERLRALRRVSDKGAKTGIRLDPVILFPGWKEAYADLAKEAGRLLRGAPRPSVEIGAFRCPRKSGERIRSGPFREIMATEILLERDGRWRYFWPLREEAFRFVSSAFEDALELESPPALVREPAWMHARVFGTEDGGSRRDRSHVLREGRRDTA